MRAASGSMVGDTNPEHAMQATEVHDYARQLLESQGFSAIATAAQKARMFEQQGDKEQAENWRRIEAAILQMRGPHES
jgi:hypothetical protein